MDDIDILTHPPGMAGIMGRGPEGSTCGSCLFWRGNSEEIPDETGLRWLHRRERPLRPDKPHACWRYRQIRRAQLDVEEKSRRIPGATPGCSHWQGRE